MRVVVFYSSSPSLFAAASVPLSTFSALIKARSAITYRLGFFDAASEKIFTFCRFKPTEITTFLLSLVSEESTLRTRLADEADLLEKELARITASRASVNCGCPSSLASIAFSVTLKDNITTLGKEQAIVYDEINLNIGGAYDARNGIFTAPVDCPYEFTIANLVSGMEIVKNGKPVAKTGDRSYYTVSTNVVALDLKAGDKVWVRHKDQSDSKAINGESRTSFSEYLIEG